MNSLIGEPNIEDKYEELVNEYPQALKCIPILLAVRTQEIDVWRGGDNYSKYWFDELRLPINEYKLFMRETGLFDLISHHLINNLFDYVTGVEVGMNTNARKNRTGDMMSKIVEKYIVDAGYQLNKNY
jgi:type II restriction enzyme